MTFAVFTIGGYGHTKESFYGQLLAYGIELIVDVRQRRGMRGPKYAFLNANALQDGLAKRNIGYVHLKELAPTSEIRDAQRDADCLSKTLKRDRTALSEVFVSTYRTTVLDAIDVRQVRALLGTHSRVCLFCVEGPADACHRSLAASWLVGGQVNTVRNIGGAHEFVDLAVVGDFKERNGGRARY